MSDQPVISFPKSPLTSTTVWLNILGPIIAYLSTRYGLNLTPDQQAQVVIAVMSLANIVLRWLNTQGPISLTAPMRFNQAIPINQTMLFSPHLPNPLILPPGAHEVVVPPPPVPLTPTVTVRDLTK